jgi:hypothetical protein
LFLSFLNYAFAAKTLLSGERIFVKIERTKQGRKGGGAKCMIF